MKETSKEIIDEEIVVVEEEVKRGFYTKINKIYISVHSNLKLKNNTMYE